MIQKVKLENFKSISKAELKLDRLNILVGPNGSGKSNFIGLFRLLERLVDQRLGDYFFQSGGVNDFLFKGFENTQQFTVYLEMGSLKSRFSNTYRFEVISDGEKHAIQNEKVGFWDSVEYKYPKEYNFRTQHTEALVARKQQLSESYNWALNVANYVSIYLRDLKLYHFHDTSDNAQSKLPQSIEDVYEFKSEAENLAPFLLHLKEEHPETYYKIIETIRLVFPLFHDFVLEESPKAKGKVVLRWREKTSGMVFSSKQISDGTLRFICLATLFLQPPSTSFVPQTILLDEPELGLHPFAIHVLADLIHKASLERQIILATQSVSLLNYFSPNDLVVTDRDEQGATVFKRLKDEDYEVWLEDYSLGQLWEDNFFGGRP